MKIIKDVNGLLEELAGPSIEQAGNEEAVVADDATKDATQEIDGEKTNTEVYPSDEHEQTEEVKEVVVTEGMNDEQLKEALLKAGYKTTELDEALAELKEELAGPSIEQAGNEEAVVEQDATKEEVKADDAEQTNTDVYTSDEHEQTEEVKEVEIKEELAGPSIEQAGNEEAVVADDATKETAQEADAEQTNTDVYPSDEHEQVEEVKEVQVTESCSKGAAKKMKVKVIKEDALEEPAAATENDAVISDAPAADGADAANDLAVENGTEATDTQDITNPAEETAAEIDGLLSDNSAVDTLSEGFKKLFEGLNRINDILKEEGPAIEQADNEEAKVEKDATSDKVETDDAEKANTDVYCDCTHDQTDDVKEVEIKEELAGPSIEQAGNEEAVVEDDATKETPAEDMTGEKTNTEVYPSDEHKQVEEVVDIVVEAAIYCREHNIETSRENVAKAIRTLHESENISIDFADKSYDVDADIESAEKLGDDTNNKEYEDLQGEGSDAAKAEESEVTAEDIQESVKYNSLKEACMLDEGYFWNDSVTVNTASEKVEKLKEQVSLLIARENADPRYDELLKAAITARRLQESICNEYSDIANDRVNLIIGEQVKRKHVFTQGNSQDYSKYTYYNVKNHETGEDEKRVKTVKGTKDLVDGSDVTTSITDNPVRKYTKKNGEPTKVQYGAYNRKK